MKTTMVMTNQYGEIVAELERDGGFFWRVPTRSMYRATCSRLKRLRSKRRNID